MTHKDTEQHENTPGPATTSTESGKSGAHKDVVSDPAEDDKGSGADWSGEGGATPEGPATDTDD
ncbi:hypothetical protein CBI38_06240 [Rhodococcus oxybenzonivorans]|jgi:hypothetical protein|uniref:PI-type proteinase n=2 Tax=Rhodococcus TaxID=1827 RepID=A0A2S2BRL8_9NOCA|nr:MULTISPECIES: hypothetical protein [Rhodococcus]AWK71239.1 hypothetical protein CBI38_06240 [Rhodococcus oxybenzonivorans]QTJ65831.1 hypothetical protein HYG77_09630 [Rhodococcus sp. ZPP]